MDEIGKVDLVTQSPQGRITLVIVDDRKWSEIKAYHTKYGAKVRAYKRFLESPKFKEKYGNKEYEILLMTPEKPPATLQEFLDKDGVKWKKL